MYFSNVLAGALTAKSYAFMSRPWELEERFSFDFTDSLLVSLKFFFRGLELIRVLPGIRDLSAIEWIADRARFFYSSLRVQRLDFPLIRLIDTNVLKRVGWLCAFYYYSIFKFGRFLPLQFFKVQGFYNSVFGRDICIDFVIGRIGLDFLWIWRSLGPKMFAYNRVSYHTKSMQTILNNTNRFEFGSRDFEFGDKSNINYMFFFFNPRLEFPLLNIYFRLNVLRAQSVILSFGTPGLNLNYKVYDLGLNNFTFLDFAFGKLPLCRFFSSNLANFQIIRGWSSVTGVSELLSSFYLLCFKMLAVNLKAFSFCSVVQDSTVIDLNEVSIPMRLSLAGSFFQSPLLYVCESNEFDLHLNSYAFVVYQGFQAEGSCRFADLVFPAKSFFEIPFMTYDYKLNFRRFEPVMNTKTGKNPLDILLNLNNFSFERSRVNFKIAQMRSSRYVIKRILKQFYRFFCELKLPKICLLDSSIEAGVPYTFISADSLVEYFINLFMFKNVFFTNTLLDINLALNVSLVGTVVPTSANLGSFFVNILKLLDRSFFWSGVSRWKDLGFYLIKCFVFIKLSFLKSTFIRIKTSLLRIMSRHLLQFYELCVTDFEFYMSKVFLLYSTFKTNFSEIEKFKQKFLQVCRNLVLKFFEAVGGLFFFSDMHLSSLIRYSKVLFLKDGYFEHNSCGFVH